MLISLTLWSFLFFSSGHISSTEIEQAVKDYISKQISLSPEDYIIDFRTQINDVIISTEDYSISIVPSKSSVLRGNVTLPVEVSSIGKLIKRILLSIKIRTFETVCSSTREVSKGEILKNEDIIEKRIETTSLNIPFVSIKNDCLNKRATKNLIPGATIFQSMIENVPLVSRGKVVKVFSNANNVAITTTGEAQQDGTEGEVIKVRLSISRDIVKAKILDTQSVVIIQ